MAAVVTNSLKTQIDVEGKEVMIKQSFRESGQRIVGELRDDTTLLPLPYLVLNPNSLQEWFRSLVLFIYPILRDYLQ